MTNQEFITYILQSPENSNSNVIKGILKQMNKNDSIVEKIIKYIINTPENTNANILIELLESIGEDQRSSNLVGIGQVGYMII